MFIKFRMKHFICFFAFIIMSKVNAQQYLYLINQGNNYVNFQRYDILNDTWVTLPDKLPIHLDYPPVAIAAKKTIYAYNYLTGRLNKYNFTTQTWENIPGSGLVYPYSAVKIGNYIYYGNSNNYKRFDLTTETITGTITCPSGAESYPATTDGQELYRHSSVDFLKWNPQTNVWTTLAFSGMSGPSLCYQDGYIYAKGNGDALFKRYEIATNTWTDLANGQIAGYPSLVSDGQYIYMMRYGYANLRRYDPATNTWSANLANAPFSAIRNGLAFLDEDACENPFFSLATVSNTCNGLIAQNDGQIVISSITNGTKFGYSIGTTYAGPDFNSATTITGNTATITSLPNPETAQFYTVRVYCNATTFKDKVVVLPKVKCAISDLSLSISPPSQSGSNSELLSYVLTVTNAGPNNADNVKISVISPEPHAEIVSFVSDIGTYNSATKIWTIPSLPVGSNSLTFTVMIN